MGSFDDFVATLKAAGVTSVRLDFGLPSVDAVPSDAAAPSTPTAAVVAESHPRTREQIEAEAARKAAQDREDLYAATGVEPVDLLDVMGKCDEEFSAWQSENAVGVANEGTVLVDPLGMEAK